MMRMKINKFFLLKKEVMLVEGRKGGLLQDLGKNKIYSIDFEAKKLLSMLLSGNTVEEATRYMDERTYKEFIDYLNLLVEKDLGFYSEVWIERHEIQKVIEKNIDTVWLELRKACNLKCCHCYMDCTGGSDSDLDILSLEDWKKILDQIDEYKPKKVILIGGEPLLFKEIYNLIEYIKEKLQYVQIILYSNLTMLNKELVVLLKKNHIKVVTSIYSNKPHIHDKITGHIGSFDNTVNAISILRNEGIYVKANAVIMKENYKEVEEIKKFIYELTGVRGRIDIIRDVGKSKEHLIPKEMSKDTGRIRTEADFKGISSIEFLRNYSGNSCWQGKINITCDGYVSPCIMGENFIDKNFNLKRNSLAAILNDYLIPKFWSLSRDKIEICKDCEYRYVCKDCRPMCIENNNIHNRGKLCTYNPYNRQWEIPDFNNKSHT